MEVDTKNNNMKPGLGIGGMEGHSSTMHSTDF